MKKLSLTEPYSVDELAKELNLSGKLRNGIRNNFGDPVIISELTQITQREFLRCRLFGRKSWCEFNDAFSKLRIPNRAVELVNRTNRNSITVEIDTSRPFAEVIHGLAKIIKK